MAAYGLRPARYKISDDGLLTLGSEVGLLTVDDAKVIEPGQPIYQGKDAIRKYVSDSLKTPGFKIHWTSEDPVFSPDGKMAYMYGIVEITMPDPKAGLVTVHARGLTIWRHESDGEWRCVLDMSNEAPPAT